MHEMTKGSNVGLAALSDDTGSVIVSLSWSSAAGAGDADVSVLLLGGNGKVRSDADFFFYNNPASPDGSVQLLGKTPTGSGSEDRISLDLTAMPPEVDRAVLAASQYGDARFGELDDLRLTLADRAGEALLGYTIAGATTESAFLFGELYRRGEEWKFRAIGQGYETGLAGLATDFGIDVDEGSEESGESDGLPAEGPWWRPCPRARCCKRRLPRPGWRCPRRRHVRRRRTGSRRPAPGVRVPPRRRSRCPRRRRSRWPRTTVGRPHGSFPRAR